MEMKQLQYFVVSVDTGSISKAAEMLYTTQPHVSMTIGKMEKSLGVRLLRRSKKGVEMTVEGELVYEQARRILKDMQVIQQVQTSVKSEVFCLSSMPSNLLAGLFAEILQAGTEPAGQISGRYPGNGAASGDTPPCRTGIRLCLGISEKCG